MLKRLRRAFWLLLVGTVVFVPFGSASAQPAVDTQLCFAIDGSGSISPNDFTTEKQGIGNAIKNPTIMPQDGSVEVSAVLFSSTATVVVNSTVINSQAAADAVGDAILALAQPAATTNVEDAIVDCAAEITGSPNFTVAERQEINITTDGLPTTSNSGGDPAADAIAARGNAVAAGIDYVDGELVNAGTPGLTFMTALVWPQPAEVKTYPEALLAVTGFVYVVEEWEHYEPAVRAKVPTVVVPREGLHYKCYDVPGPAAEASVSLETQLGIEPSVEVGAGHYLCPPAIKTVLPDGDPEGNLDEPHLRCYDIDEPPPGDTVNIATQFGNEDNVVLGRARELCVPTLKEVIIPPEPPPPGSLPLPTKPHYKCYEIEGHDPDVIVNLETQFGLESNVDVGQAIRLCLPALKNGEGGLNAPHLECYVIDEPAPSPQRTVRLETQFFHPEPDEQVGMAKLLCVQAGKTVVPSPTPTPPPPTPTPTPGPGVGGVAQMPDVDGSASETTESFGASSFPYGALVSGLAAALALVTGGWYVRRQWLR